jgi:KUP system potassium uptake protein
MSETHPSSTTGRPRYLALLSLGALGVVYGDIGTSPLYAVRESFSGHFGVAPLRENVLGVLSLITWSLAIIVAIKYHLVVIRADNEGEGGILALTALIRPRTRDAHGTRRSLASHTRATIVMVGLFGAALLYGDGILTPAISVLSAVEGIKIYQPGLADYVVPLTVVILILLFIIQRTGTLGIGKLFGPITLVWFLAIALLGVRGILRAPEVLGAVNPRHAILFFQANGLMGILVLGAVFLVVTGGEALYADLGHFGHLPIQLDWFLIVFPCLLLNYFGQAALVLSDPSTIVNPFYLLAPHWALWPLILLATCATIIASQAVISGVFSMTMQAVQLGFWPRADVRHTSSREFGQIYVPSMNWSLLVMTVLLVIGFRSSSALAGAYGIAIVCTMLVTTLLLYIVLPEKLGWPKAAAWALLTVFLVVELLFFAANIIKIAEGGWVPLLIGAIVFLMMTTWRSVRRELSRRINERLQPLDAFVKEIPGRGAARVPGDAIYMTGNAHLTPPALLMNVEHQKTLHARVLIVTVDNVSTPHVRDEHRLHVEDLGHGVHRVIARYGFMETPDVQHVLNLLRRQGIHVSVEQATFFLGRERVLARGRNPIARWRVGLFAFMSRNSQRATAFFNIPPERVVEVGSQIEV